jgi:hypothetical protein
LFQLAASSRWKLKLFSMVVVSAFQGGIPCEEDSDEQEHQRHADRT